MTRRLGWLAGLALLSSAALGQTITPAGMWPFTPFSQVVQAVAAAYSAGAILFDGTGVDTTATHSPGLQKASALTGVVNGSKGIISLWMTCDYSDGVPKCVGTDVLGNIGQLTSGTSSESVSGIGIVVDTAGATAGNGTFRFNSNSSTEPQASAPQFGLTGTNAITPSDYGKLLHFLVVWDHSGSTFCGQIYKNGTSLGLTPSNPGGAGFSANYANAGGFFLGRNERFGTGSTTWDSSRFNGTLGEIYVNLAPASSPCSGNLIANYSVASFYSAGNPVNLGTNCATPTGAQPAVCFRWDATGATVGNEGSGGAFTSDYPAGLSAAPIGPGQSPSAPYLKFVTYGQAAGSTTVTPAFNRYTPVAGDLIVVVAAAKWGTSAARTLTISTANGFTAFGSQGGGALFEALNQSYKIAVGGDTLPVYTANSSTSGNSYLVLVYGNANATTPIGFVGTYGNGTTNTTSCSFPNGGVPHSGTTIVAVGYNWNGQEATQTLTQTGSKRRFWSPDSSFTSPASLLVNDYINVGTTSVPNATMAIGPADDTGCFIFEVQH
jgi:hypothetical protein